MLKINKNNYDLYKEVFAVIWKFEAKDAEIEFNTESSPLNILNNWEKQSESLARKGLKEGLRDSLRSLKYLSEDLKIELNNSLISRKLPSLNILMSQVKNVPKKVINKGEIKNLDEYYIVKEVLDDVEYEILELEREKLTKIFTEFELKTE